MGLQKWQSTHTRAGLLGEYNDTIRSQKPDKVQNLPHPHRPTQYGAKVQYADDKDNSPPLNPADTKYIQAVMGTLLYYGQAVDSTILTSLSSLATEQNKRNHTQHKLRLATRVC